MFTEKSWDNDTFCSPTNPKFSVFSGAFGGWTAAHAFTAAQRLSSPDQSPISLTIDFLKGIAPGDVRSAPHVISQSKSTLFARVATTQGDTPCAQSSIIFSRRRDTDRVDALLAPDAPAPESCLASNFKHPIATWIEQYEHRFVSGTLLARNPQMRSLIWARPKSATAWTWDALVAFSDANFPRIFFHYDALTPIATVTMTTYFHLTLDELGALGNDYLLVDASCATARAGLYDQSVRMWSRTGALVASSVQIAVFNVNTP